MLQPWNNGPLLTWAERNSLVPSDTPAPIRLLLAPCTYQHNPIGLTFFWFTQMQFSITQRKKKIKKKGRKQKDNPSKSFICPTQKRFSGIQIITFTKLMSGKKKPTSEDHNILF